MRLFDFPRAPNPRRVRIFIAEKGIDIPKIQVNLFRLEQLSPEFRAINPGCTVPVLETDDGVYLTECVAICRYLERMHPDPCLFGSDATEEALVLMWDNISENEGMSAAAEILRNLSPGFRNRVFPGPLNIAQMPELVERGRQRTEQFFDRIEQRLAESPFLAGDRFSFADITLLTVIEFATWVDLDATASRPDIARWYQQVSRRPSASGSIIRQG
jgi:glutathione S-transferase